MYGEVKGLSNDRVGGSVHEAESYWWDFVSWKVLSLNKVESIKELEDPESTRDLRIVSGIKSEVSKSISESWS